MLGNTLCWTLLKDLFTQNSGEYLCWTLFLLEDLFTYNTWNTLCWTLGRFIYTKHWEILEILMLNTVGRFIYIKYLEYFMLNTVGRFIYTKYWGILYVEHCGNIYLHTILGITLCWTLWENLITQNTGDYFMLNTVGRFIYT